MFHYYWAKAMFTAIGRDLYIGSMGPGGWRRRYVTDSEMELLLFVRSIEDSRGCFIAVGDPKLLEITINPIGDEELKEGASCQIHEFPDQILGTCELSNILGKWRRYEDRPECLREFNASFSKI